MIYSLFRSDYSKTELANGGCEQGVSDLSFIQKWLPEKTELTERGCG